MARYQYQLIHGHRREADDLQTRLDELGAEGWRGLGITGRRRLTVLLTRSLDEERSTGRTRKRTASAEAAAISSAAIPAPSEPTEGPSTPRVAPTAALADDDIDDLPNLGWLATELSHAVGAFDSTDDRQALTNAAWIVRTTQRESTARRGALAERRRQTGRRRNTIQLVADGLEDLLWALTQEQSDALKAAVEILKTRLESVSGPV